MYNRIRAPKILYAFFADELTFNEEIPDYICEYYCDKICQRNKKESSEDKFPDEPGKSVVCEIQQV